MTIRTWSTLSAGSFGLSTFPRIGLLDSEEIEEFLGLLAFDPFRPVKPSGIPRIDQLGLALDAERARLCRRYGRQYEKQRQQ